jgi:hypothetical protein
MSQYLNKSIINEEAVTPNIAIKVISGYNAWHC